MFCSLSPDTCSTVVGFVGFIGLVVFVVFVEFVESLFPNLDYDVDRYIIIRYSIPVHIQEVQQNVTDNLY